MVSSLYTLTALSLIAAVLRACHEEECSARPTRYVFQNKQYNSRGDFYTRETQPPPRKRVPRKKVCVFMLRIAYDPEFYAHPLPEKHRFPMEKYTLLPEQLRYEGTVSRANFFVPEPASEALVQRVHEAEYLEKLKTQQLSRKEERRTGFPLSPRLVEREFRILGGTLQNVAFALEHGLSMNIAGGTHHAYTAHGEGFCLLNDMAVAAQWLLDTGKAKRILILNLDVHQGNGTAKVLRKSRTFSLSVCTVKKIIRTVKKPPTWILPYLIILPMSSI